tara:strand:- start:51 stop:716 length:666 start_codon:yes stop_codon:yes gene_type:complete
MQIEKRILPNFGVLDVSLEKIHLDHLYHLIEKYEPDCLQQQWMLVDDDHRFKKEVLDEAIKYYISEWGFPTRLKSTHIHDLTFQKFWVNSTEVGQYQALHNHDAVFSFVVWLKIPHNSTEEQKIPDTMHPEAGDFILTYSDITGKHCKCNWKLEKEFNEGHMLIFPSELFHAVYPHFLTTDKRISVAGDIALNSNKVMDIYDQGMLLGPENSQEFIKEIHN